MLPDQTSQSRPAIWVLGTTLLGFGGGIAWLFGISRATHFDGLYGQDPYAYFDYGQQIANLIVHGHGLGYFYWPLGYPALLGFGFLIGGVSEAIAQFVTILCSATAALLIGLLAAEIAHQLQFPKRLVWISGLSAWVLLLSSGQVIQSGIVVMADMPALMWATFSAWSLACYLRAHRSVWLGLAAFGLSWATMSRWQYVALVLPWGIACACHWRRLELQVTSDLNQLVEGDGHYKRVWLRHLLVAITIGLITSTPQIIYTLQNPDPALRHEWLTSWSAANAFSRDFVTADGTFHYDQPIAEYYLLPLTSPYYLSVWLLPLVAMGLLAMIVFLVRRSTPFGLINDDARRQTESDPIRSIQPAIVRMSRPNVVPLAILLFGWIAVEYGFLIGIPYQNIRFALAFFPPLLVLVGIGIAAVLSLANQRNRLLRIGISTIVIGLSGWGTMSTLPIASGLVSSFVANKDRDLAAVRWMESQIPEASASVYTLDLALTMTHYSKLTPVQIYYETPDSLTVRLPLDRPAYALINVWTTEHQWPGKAPWIIYHWLLDNPGLDEIGTFSIYTLYRVR